MPFDHFTLIAGSYDRLPPFDSDGQLEEALALPVRGWMLDAGGGTGRVAAALRDRTGGIVVADISAGMLRRAAGKGLRAVRAPAETTPFAAEVFERILMLDAWHHVFDQEQTAAELWRVLAPGGRVIVVEPDIHRLSAKLIAIGEKILLMRSHFMASERISALFSHRGARVRVVQDGAGVIVVGEKVRQM